MSGLNVVMGGITYRADVPRADHHALTVAVHEALTGLGLEPHVQAHGMERDQWGALRAARELGAPDDGACSMTPPPSPGRRDSVSPAASDLADALVPVAAESRCGSTAGYEDHRNNGTEKCARCRRAMAAHVNRYRMRVMADGPLLIDGTGTRRRLEALAVNGWSFVDLGARLGVSGRAARKFGPGPIHRDTAAKVVRLYDELWDVPGGSLHAARRAAAKGWVPALAWDDDVIDDPDSLPSLKPGPDVVDELAVQAVLVEGVRLQLDGATAHAAVQALRGRLTSAEIGERIGTSARQVERYKARATAPRRKAA